MEDAFIVFVLGAPGAGKGTQCARIVEKYGWTHLSAGDLLRKEVAEGTALGQEAEELMQKGQMVPTSLVLELLSSAMKSSGKQRFLIDGFPRKLDQLEEFEATVKPCDAVLVFTVPEEEAVARLVKRGETSGRADDNEETIRSRFEVFRSESQPVIDHLQDSGRVHEFAASGDVEDVFAEVCGVMDELQAAADARAAPVDTNGDAGEHINGADEVQNSHESQEVDEDSNEPLVVPSVEGELPEDMHIVFVLGGPGSGKGTQCDKIKAEYDVVHLSAGDLLRAEVASGSAVGSRCETMMKEGQLVPVSVTLGLLKNAMIESGGRAFLVDGFPRALDQAEAFEAAIGAPQSVLFFDCPREEMEKRLLKRGETSGRSDDNAATIIKRFTTFLEQSVPVKDKYEELGKCAVISAVPHPDEVYEEVKQVLEDVGMPHREAAVTEAPPEALDEKPLVVPSVEGELPEDVHIVFVLGGPGSGKGTQCDKIKAEYDVVHLSAGDLLRAEVASGSAVGSRCETMMKEGQLVPVSVTLGLLKNAMIESGGRAFLVDGFPRALDQAEAFEAAIGAPQSVLFFDCPREEMEKRLLKRGETSGRSDDNAATIIKRFTTFLEQSVPVKDKYEELGKCAVISAVPHPDEVYEEVKQVLEQIGMPCREDAAVEAPEDALDEEPLVVPSVEGELPEDMHIVFVLGGPGSGKGTQCDKIKAEYDVVHLSAGDLLSAEVASSSAVGSRCETMMKEGQLVPVSVTLGLLKNAMIQSGGKAFLVDGFPRALDQAEGFEAAIGAPQSVLFFDCPREEMEKRLLKRGETSGRSDDNAATIIKRFTTFLEQSVPVKDKYEELGKCAVISAVPHPDEVYVEVKQVLEDIGMPRREGGATAQEAADDEPLVVPSVEGELPEDVHIVFVLGGPGSGKGTQCDKIKAEYDVVHLSAGDLLRAEVASGSAVGSRCETIMKEGQLVPVSVTLGLLKNAMIQSGGKAFLVDGFPRALDQAEGFEAAIGAPQSVLFFDCPREEMEKRLLKRGETSGRSDDNAATIIKRFTTFLEQSVPVKDKYEELGKCAVISAVPHPDEVYVEVKQVLEDIGMPRREGGATAQEAADDEPLVVPSVEGELPEDVHIVFVLGGPGSGKGTQCDKIKAEYDVVHLSAGDLLRAEVASGSAVGSRCETIMKEGQLVPVSVTLGLLKNAMIQSGGKAFLVDGFPRALDQAEGFEAAIGAPQSVLFFDCPREEMEKRLLKRGETSGRSDDNAATIIKRFTTFLEQSVPVKDKYEELGKCAVISAVPHPDEVYVEVKQVLEDIGMPRREGGATAQEAANDEPLVVPSVEGELPKDVHIVFVLGGPGSGKGTQCDKIKAEYDVVHLSAGDLLRAEVASGSAVGSRCETMMKEGQLVPVSVTLGLLKNAMIQSGGKAFLVDGFPRALDQAEAFEAAIGAPQSVLFFDCPREEMEKRLLKRGETSGRSDDNAATIIKRFTTFLEQSVPVKDKYEELGKCAVISAVPHPDEVYVEVKQVLEDIGMPHKVEVAVAAETVDDEPLVVPSVEGELPEDVHIVFVLGGPGSGKGTQCDKIKAEYDVVHLSAGDLLRAEVASGSAVGSRCETMMKDGQLVPVSVTLGLLKNAMIQSGGKAFLVDGFPRALDQAEAFEAAIGVPQSVLFFDCPREEMEKRLLKRGETSGRSDDNAATIIKRFTTFLEQSVPVKDKYEELGKCAVISAVPHPDEVYSVVKDVLENIGLPHKAKEASSSQASVEELVDSISSVLVVSGPSGVGKGTLITRLLADHGDKFGFIVSHTTRAPRPGEENAVHYWFSTRDEVEADVAKGLFLEVADVHGNMYGTSLAAVTTVSQAGKISVLDIDVQGAENVRNSAVGSKAVLVFIAPPSLEALEARLRGRGTETGDKIQVRLGNATAEVQRAEEPGLFDVTIVNGESVDQAYIDMLEAIERLIPGTFSEADFANARKALQPEVAASAPSPIGSAPASRVGTPLVAQPPVGSPQLSRSSTPPMVHPHSVVPSEGTDLQVKPAPPAVAVASADASGLPVRQYMDQTVVPVLREALRALNESRPDDPLQYLSDYLLQARAKLVAHA